jgi:hypothetical protein
MYFFKDQFLGSIGRRIKREDYFVRHSHCPHDGLDALEKGADIAFFLVNWHNGGDG